MLEEFFLSLGKLGLFLILVLATSILPIPSELILFLSALTKINFIEFFIIASSSHLIGSIIGYYFGKFGSVIIEKFGKYFFIDKKILKKIEKKFKRHDKLLTFYARSNPFFPFKVYSIAAGFAKTNFLNYLIFSFLGISIRVILMFYFGSFIFSFKNNYLIIVSSILVISLPLLFEKHFAKNRK